MFRRYIILSIAFLIAISVTSCCSYEETPSQAAAEGFGEALGEIIVGLEIDMKMLLGPSALFQKTNSRWPDSKEELAEFSSEMGFNTPQLYWDICEDMCFYTQDDGSLKIKFTRVITDEDGTQYRFPKEYTLGKPEFDSDDPNLAHTILKLEEYTLGKPELHPDDPNLAHMIQISLTNQFSGPRMSLKPTDFKHSVPKGESL